MGEEGWEGARSKGGCEGRWRSEGAGFPPPPPIPPLPLVQTKRVSNPCLAFTDVRNKTDRSVRMRLKYAGVSNDVQ